MANTVLHKSSSTASAVPAAGSLTPRELALNTADGRLFTKTDAGAVVEFARKDATYTGTITSGQVVAALGYTPANPGGLTVSVINTNTTATAGTTYVLIATLTLGLPASPAPGAQVSISNRSGVATCVVGRNSQNIMGLAEDLTLDIEASISLVFADTTRGWVLL